MGHNAEGNVGLPLMTVNSSNDPPTGLTPGEIVEIRGYVAESIRAQMQAKQWFDALNMLTGKWITDHVITTFGTTGTELDVPAITTYAKNKFDAAHVNDNPPHGPYTFTVTSAILTYFDAAVEPGGNTASLEIPGI